LATLIPAALSSFGERGACAGIERPTVQQKLDMLSELDREAL